MPNHVQMAPKYGQKYGAVNHIPGRRRVKVVRNPLVTHVSCGSSLAGLAKGEGVSPTRALNYETYTVRST